MKAVVLDELFPNILRPYEALNSLINGEHPTTFNRPKIVAVSKPGRELERVKVIANVFCKPWALAYTLQNINLFSVPLSAPPCWISWFWMGSILLAATRFFHSRRSLKIAPTTKYKTYVAVIHRYELVIQSRKTGFCKICNLFFCVFISNLGNRLKVITRVKMRDFRHLINDLSQGSVL